MGLNHLINYLFNLVKTKNLIQIYYYLIKFIVYCLLMIYFNSLIYFPLKYLI